MKTSTRILAVAAATLMIMLASGSFALAGDTNLAPIPAFPQPVPSSMSSAPSTLATPGAGALTSPRSTRDVELSFWASEIVKLTRGGIDDDVILSFLDNVGTFGLGADQIIFLKQQGVSRDVITAMLQHDFEIGAGLRPMPTVSVGFARNAMVFTSSNISASPGVVPVSAPPSPVAEPTPIASPPIYSSENVDLDFPLSADLLAYQPGIPEHGYRVREPYPEKVTEPIIIIPVAGRLPNILLVQSAQ